MKKLLYIFALLSVLSVTISSCATEEIKPIKEGNNLGGGVSDRL